MAESVPPYPGLPRWVKGTALVVLVAILIAFLAAALLGGDHGPARHVGP